RAASCWPPRAHADTLTSTTVNPRRSSMLSMTVLDLSSAINDFANFLQICCEVPGVGADTSQRVASKITGKTDWLPAKLQSTARLTRPLHRRARRRSPASKRGVERALIANVAGRGR